MSDKNNGKETNNSADPVVKLVESPKNPDENLVPWPYYAEFFDFCCSSNIYYQ